ncbi:MAG: hypothetical protein ACK58Q_12045, partial [Chitinophagales bacterium]
MFIKTIKLIYLLTTSTLICKSSISQIDRGSTKCNIEKSINMIIDLGFERVLTSGGRATAKEG